MKENLDKSDIPIKIESQLNEFLEPLGAKLSDYFGFRIIPEKLDQQSITSLSIPTHFYEPLTKHLLKKLKKVIKDYVKLYTVPKPHLINNIIEDLSLYFIFDEYNEKYANLINELKNIGARSYEGKTVDIGVLYCPNDKALTQLEDLKADVVHLPEKKSITAFFNEEKPFLRLIDNMSLALIIDSEFKVIALLRKRSKEKSLNYILEKEFNSYLKDKLHNTIINFFFEMIEEALDGPDMKIDFKRMKHEQSINCPEYTYFSLKSNKINIFTKNDFVLTYYNGDWKLKHYNIIRSILVNHLFLAKLKPLVKSVIASENDLVFRTFQSIINDTDNFVETLLRLSQNNVSSIILIDSTNKKSHREKHKRLEQLKVNAVLKNQIQKPNPTYLNVIKNKKINMKILNADYYLIESISSIDGALVLDADMRIVSFGEVINTEGKQYPQTYGTGTTAARYASKHCLAIKISEDGDIYIFKEENLKLKI
ncbi:hypothetical protein [Bacillus atrophaeus]|uniref:hypothetical protein n=1 Tax=Bacillus atrophaeus TaxID=1452 RepID=UPI002DB6DEE7|nr:hypothetical protein [Bacillus atrophaeus]MEC0768502.1 diadenylate cyclase [Bacillus atrophaeus]MEC0778871.1 diadenylate cyclase [Bacillus atrophaeus]MEC0807646.1 diadenylate cyclase [Bacillus atrophaeus]